MSGFFFFLTGGLIFAGGDVLYDVSALLVMLNLPVSPLNII